MENVKRMCREYQRNQERMNPRSVVEDVNEEEDEERDAAPLLPEIVLASGERDALNILAAGFAPVWKNSETAMLLPDQYKEIKKYCNRLVNLPDIDETGIKKARELGLKYLDIATAWLPSELKNFTDFRGNTCKDVTDHQWHFSDWALERVIASSITFKPWDEIVEYNKKKKINKIEYAINNAQCYEFMYANGFHRVEKKNEKSGFTFVRVEKNIVKEIKPVEIKSFIHEWLKQNGYGAKLRNVFYRTTQLNEASLNGNLDVAEFDFTDHDKHHQMFYFRNETVRVTKTEIESATAGSSYVWQDEILDHDFKKLEPFFTWHKDENNKIVLDSINESFSMVKFIMNTSRVFWRKEKDGTITDDQRKIQEQHFLNKCFILGYIMHRYKNASASWSPFAVDSRDGSVGEANGGSGKSLFLKIPSYYMTWVVLNGRDKDLTKNSHLFDRVNENTDYVLIDDCTSDTDFDFFFNFITGDFTVNPKHNLSFSIPYKDSPKIAFASNYMLRKINPSVERRLIYGVFSDYYHKCDNKVYSEDSIPSAEFGKNLIIDYTPDEMNQLSNFLMQCTHFFMALQDAKPAIKLDPPMENIERRILRQQIGENFLDWANTYFSITEDLFDPSGHVDCEIKRRDLFEAYKGEYNDKYTTPKNFKDKLTALCKYKGWELNPDEMCTDKELHKIIRKIEGMTHEVFYIETGRKATPQPTPKTDEDLSVKDPLDM
jgi:hypothetical protein